MALVAATLVVDQLTKQLLLGYLMAVDGHMVPIIDGFFRLVVVYNQGVSFGLLGGDRPLPAWLLSSVAVAVCIGLFIWLRRTDRSPDGVSALSWAGPSAMLSTAPAGARCSTLPTFTWVNGIGRPSMSPTRRSSLESG
jgi:hypothetical protein